MKLGQGSYNRDAVDVAKDLLGKVLVRRENGKSLKGIIIETEAYMGVTDMASHAYNGKMTDRTKVMYGSAGTAYVYFVYGLYYCFNVVTREEGVPHAVLIRSIKPLENLDMLSQNRFQKNYQALNKAQKKNLANGPAKLCMSLNITKKQNGLSLLGEDLFIEDEENGPFEIVSSKRIGIDYAGEAKDFLWRFEALIP
jgi:DNA-3-methyladenine glycosylase